MTFSDYMELKKECERVGIENDSCLSQLLHILQAKHVAVDAHNSYMKHMNEWESNIAKTVRERIKQAEQEVTQ